MENENTRKSYELAFHINPDIEETEVKKHAQEVYDLVTQDGGIILTSPEPKRIHLSYPIKQKSYAYFCVISFSADPEAIEKINSQLKLHAEVLRSVIVTLPKAGKEIRTFGSPRIRQIRPKMTTSSIRADGKTIEEKLTKDKTEKEVVSEKMIDDEIEEAIKGIE